jgi:aquaporin Z
MNKYLTEFVGTCFLVAVVGLAGLHAATLTPLLTGLTLAVLVYMGWHVSGANYNPAVSLALVVRGKLSFLDFLPYLVAQVGGAFTGASIVVGLTGHTFGPVLPTGATPVQAMLAEGLFAGLLCLVVLNVTTVAKTEGNGYYGQAIGLSMAVGCFCIGPISGGCLNPAIAVGSTLMRVLRGDLIGVEMVGIYIVGPLAGGLLASAIFTLQTGEKLFETEEEQPGKEPEGRGRLRIVDHRREAA